MMSKQGKPVKSNFRELTKPGGIKLTELSNSLQLMNESNKNIRDRKSYFILAIAAQLRGLLIDNDRRAEPRLVQIAKDLNYMPDIFCLPSMNDVTSRTGFETSADVIISGPPISSVKILSGQQKISLSDLIDFPCLCVHGVNYTVRTLIEWFANRSGGAHFSKTAPKDFYDLLILDSLNISALTNLFLQISEAIVEIGRRLLCKICEQEIHLVFAIVTSQTYPTHILDIGRPNSFIRTTIAITDKNRLFAHFSSVDGSVIQMESAEIFDFSKLTHVRVSLKIAHDLRSRVELSINGTHRGFVEANFPLINIPEWVSFDALINRVLGEETGQNAEIAIASAMVIRHDADEYAHSNIDLNHQNLISDTDTEVIVLYPKCYGTLKKNGCFEFCGNHAVKRAIEFMDTSTEGSADEYYI